MLSSDDTPLTDETQFVDAFIADLNGVLRGKRLRVDAADSIARDGVRLPRSLIGVDIWGTDVLGNGLVLETGDGDGICTLALDDFQPVPWDGPGQAQALLMMNNADRSPFPADPRQALISVAERLTHADLLPVAALELEFYLIDRDQISDGVPANPSVSNSGQIASMSEIAANGPFLDDLYAACDAQGLPIGASVVESGPSQFEINLDHQTNVVRAADHAVLLRRAIGGVAARHGRIASFMAKPFADLPGNGMHAHISLMGPDGRNLFDNGGPEGNALLRSAIGGLLASAGEAMIFFAPHYNSGKRFMAESHAPTRLGWGYENRTAGIRVPDSPGKDRRFEHRMAGSDANPYLVLAAMLAGVWHGISNKLTAPPPLTGNSYERTDLPLVCNHWGKNIDAFENGTILPEIFGPELTSVFVALKRQEQSVMARHISALEYQSYFSAF